MPLWFDLLRTPMAAPETRTLKRMRVTLLALFVVLAISSAWLSPLAILFGQRVVLLIGALFIGTVFYGALYATRKHLADTAYLDSLGEETP